jgi:hypothetical protein
MYNWDISSNAERLVAILLFIAVAAAIVGV